MFFQPENFLGKYNKKHLEYINLIKLENSNTEKQAKQINLNETYKQTINELNKKTELTWNKARNYPAEKFFWQLLLNDIQILDLEILTIGKEIGYYMKTSSMLLHPIPEQGDTLSYYQKPLADLSSVSITELSDEISQRKITLVENIGTILKNKNNPAERITLNKSKTIETIIKHKFYFTTQKQKEIAEQTQQIIEQRINNRKQNPDFDIETYLRNKHEKLKTQNKKQEK